MQLLCPKLDFAGQLTLNLDYGQNPSMSEIAWLRQSASSVAFEEALEELASSVSLLEESLGAVDGQNHFNVVLGAGQRQLLRICGRCK